MRESAPPDLSEQANGAGVDAPLWPVDTPELPEDPDAPKLEDYRPQNGTIDGEAFLADSRAHKTVPLSHLTTAQRRERFASGRRTT